MSEYKTTFKLPNINKKLGWCSGNTSGSERSRLTISRVSFHAMRFSSVSSDSERASDFSVLASALTPWPSNQPEDCEFDSHSE